MRSESPNGYSRFKKFYLHISMDRPSAPAHKTCRIGLYSGQAGRRLFAVWRLGGPLWPVQAPLDGSLRRAKNGPSQMRRPAWWRIVSVNAIRPDGRGFAFRSIAAT